MCSCYRVISIFQSRGALLAGLIVEHSDFVLWDINPLPHGDANRHTIFKRKN